MSRISDISNDPQICPGARVHDSSEDSGIIQSADTEPLINNSSEPPIDEWQDVNNSRYGSIQHVASYQSISAEYERTEDAEGVYLDILGSSKMVFVKISHDFITPLFKFWFISQISINIIWHVCYRYNPVSLHCVSRDLVPYL